MASRYWRLAIAALVVASLATAFGFARTPAASAAAAQALYGQCGPAVHNGTQLIDSWGAMNVLNSPNARLIAQRAGWNATDGSMVSFITQRGRQFRLAAPADIEDFGCHVGSMFSVGKRPYGAGEYVIGIVPGQYSPSDVSGTPRAGFVRRVVWIWTVGRGNCSNGFSGYVQVVMYVRVHHKVVHVVPKKKARESVVWAWKYAQVNGKLVNGYRFSVFATGNRYGKHYTITSGKWTALGPFKAGHVPRSFTEIVRAPWRAQKSAVQKVRLVRGKFEVIFSNYAAPAKPKPTPLPPPPPSVTVVVVCGNATVVVGNNNTVTGNNQGGNCNSSPPPPSCGCTPPPAKCTDHSATNYGQAEACKYPPPCQCTPPPPPTCQSDCVVPKTTSQLPAPPPTPGDPNPTPGGTDQSQPGTPDTTDSSSGPTNSDGGTQDGGLPPPPP